MTTTSADRPTVAGDRSVHWAGELPSEWPIKPLKYVCAVNRHTLDEATPPDRPIRYIDISTVDSDGHVGQGEEMTFATSPSRARRVLHTGDVFVSTVRTYLTAIGFCDFSHDGTICSTGFAVLSAGPAVDPKFLFYWMRSALMVSEIVSRSVGVSYPAINASEVGNLPFPTTSLGRQRAIAAFLDRKTAQIDNVIARKLRQVELICRKRDAVVFMAVTRGIDGALCEETSQVVWMEGAPRHWAWKHLKYAFRTIDYGISDSVSPEGRYRVLRMGDIQNGEVLTTNAGFVDAVDPRLVLDTNDLLFNRTNSLEQIGKVGLFRGSRSDNVTFASYLVRFRTGANADPAFMNYLLNAPPFLSFVRGLAFPSINQANLNPTRYGAVQVCLPPVDEQRRIGRWLDERCSHLASISSRMISQVDRLREYRRTLISSAVTGRLPIPAEAAA